MPGEGWFLTEAAARCSIHWVRTLIKSSFLLPSCLCLFTTVQGKGLCWAVPKVSRAFKPLCKPTSQHFLASQCLLLAAKGLTQQNFPPKESKSPGWPAGLATKQCQGHKNGLEQDLGEQRPGCHPALTNTGSDLGPITVPLGTCSPSLKQGLWGQMGLLAL